MNQAWCALYLLSRHALNNDICKIGQRLFVTENVRKICICFCCLSHKNNLQTRIRASDLTRAKPSFESDARIRFLLIVSHKTCFSYTSCVISPLCHYSRAYSAQIQDCASGHNEARDAVPHRSLTWRFHILP